MTKEKVARKPRKSKAETDKKDINVTYQKTSDITKGTDLTNKCLRRRLKYSLGATLAIVTYIIILMFVIIWLGYDLNSCSL